MQGLAWGCSVPRMWRQGSCSWRAARWRSSGPLPTCHPRRFRLRSSWSARCSRPRCPRWPPRGCAACGARRVLAGWRGGSGPRSCGSCWARWVQARPRRQSHTKLGALSVLADNCNANEAHDLGSGKPSDTDRPPLHRCSLCCRCSCRRTCREAVGRPAPAAPSARCPCLCPRRACRAWWPSTQPQRGVWRRTLQCGLSGAQGVP